MKANTKIFGEIDITEDKIIHFEGGIIGYPELTEFTLIHDSEDETETGLRWIQSMQEPAFAMPVIDPLVIVEEYDPTVNDELLISLGQLEPENMLVLVTMTVPSDLTKMSINLKGPIIINVANKKACQVIVEGDKYPVKYPVYDLLQARKAGV